MPWQELTITRGGTTDRSKWRIGVGANGVVRIYPPTNHDLVAARYVRSFFGTGTDAGWVLLKASNAGGRKVNRGAKGGAPAHLAFSTMPGLAKDFRLGVIEVVGVDLPNNGGTKVQLPWVEAPNARPPAPIVSPEVANAAKRIADDAAPGPVAQTRPFAREADKSRRTKPERPSRAAEQAAIEAHLATKGVSKTLTLEQAAEYLRTKGRDVHIRVGNAAKGNNQTVWLDAPVPYLDGKQIEVEELYRVVNEYRERAELPPVEVPAPPPLKAGPLPSVGRAA